MEESVIIDIKISQDEAVKRQVELKKSLEDLKTSQKELSAAQKDVTTASEANASQMVINEAKIKNLNVQLNANSKIIQQVTNDTAGETGAYQRLNQEYIVAVQRAQDLGAAYGINDKRFIAASNNALNLKDTMTGLNAASGSMSKANNNAYYSTFQLTQVMRELPNFAIDARVGFMSLSNNLPMLADGFKQVSNSVDDAGKKLGNVGALKVFAKSLLSFNTVMIAGVTLMTLFGDKIVDYIAKMFKGSDATDSFTLSQKALKDVLKDEKGGLTDVVSKQLELGVLLTKSKTDTKYADAAVKLYNETLGVHYGKVKDVNAATEGYIKNSKNFITATMYQMAALKVMDDAATKITERQVLLNENASIKNSKALKEQYDVLYSIAKNTPEGLEKINNWIQKLNTIDPASISVDKLGNAFRSLVSIDGSRTFIKNAAEIAKLDSAIKETTKSSDTLLSKSADLYVNLDDQAKAEAKTAAAIEKKRKAEEAAANKKAKEQEKAERDAERVTAKQISSDQRIIDSAKKVFDAQEDYTLISEEVYNKRIQQSNDIAEEEFLLLDRRAEAEKMTDESIQAAKDVIIEENLTRQRDLLTKRIDMLTKSMQNELQIELLHNEELRAGRQKTFDEEAADLRKSYDNEAAQLKLSLDNKQMTQEEYNQKITLLDQQLKTDLVNNEYDKQQQIRDAQLTDYSNQLLALQENGANEYQIRKDQLDLQMAAEIEAAKQTGADTLIIEKKYAALKKAVDEEAADAKLDALKRIFGNVETLFGSHTKMAKMAASAQVAIDTYKGVQAAMASPLSIATGGVWGIAESATIIASGLASIKGIWATKSGLKGDSSSGGTQTVTAVTPTVSTPSASTAITSGFVSQQSGQTQAAATTQAVSNAMVSNQIVPVLVTSNLTDAIATEVSIKANNTI